MARIIIDPARGGCDTRYIYGDRRDKTDNLMLAIDLQEILNSEGIETVLTRTEDIYLPGYERVNIVNQLEGDFVFSFSWVGPSFDVGLPRVKFFVSEEDGVATQLAENIIMNLPEKRYEIIGIAQNTELPILSYVNKPGLIMEIEYPNNMTTNIEFEMISNEIAMAISNGIIQTFGNDVNDGENRGDGGEMSVSVQYEMHESYDRKVAECSVEERVIEERKVKERTVEERIIEEKKATDDNTSINRESDFVDLPMNEEDEMNQKTKMYSVQVGLFRNESNADNMLRELAGKGYDGNVLKKGDFFSVHVGKFINMDDAVAIEQILRIQRYNTLLVTVD